MNTLSVTAFGDREIHFSRSFDAPRQLVFNAITQPALLLRWFVGPPGWTLTVCQVDLRVGGAYRYVWRQADGTEMGMGGVFLEVTPPERIVQTEKFDMFPTESLGTLTLTEHAGRTTLHITMVYATPDVRDAMLRTPMEQGMSAGYLRLDQLLATLGGVQ